MELIDKDALVAEIERQIKLFSSENYKCSDRLTVEERLFTLNSIKEFIETLEVKESNLNNEKCKDLNNDGNCIYAFNKTGKVMRCEYINCSRKIKTQKGE